MGIGAHRIFGLSAVVTAALALPACSAGGIKLSALAAAPQTTARAVEAPQPQQRVASADSSLLAYAAPMEGPAEINALVSKYAAHYDVPESLIHRVIRRESTYNPRARNGPYKGLMQISTATAKSMGYRGGPDGLLDADTNLRYAVKYLRGAWIVGGYNQDAAVRHYSRGYYYDAKAKGLLVEVGLR